MSHIDTTGIIIMVHAYDVPWQSVFGVRDSAMHAHTRKCKTSIQLHQYQNSRRPVVIASSPARQYGNLERHYNSNGCNDWKQQGVEL